MNSWRTVFVSITLFISLLSACIPISQESDSSQFKEPDPEIYVSIMPALLEYFYLRKQAVLSGETEAFYKRLPDLEVNTNTERGINTESTFISNMHALSPVDGNIMPEFYEKIKISQSEEGIQVLVHGIELYTIINSRGEYSESGGEFKIKFSMRQAGKNWQIFKTDVVTLQEWKNFKP